MNRTTLKIILIETINFNQWGQPNLVLIIHSYNEGFINEEDTETTLY